MFSMCLIVIAAELLVGVPPDADDDDDENFCHLSEPQNIEYSSVAAFLTWLTF